MCTSALKPWAVCFVSFCPSLPNAYQNTVTRYMPETRNSSDILLKLSIDAGDMDNIKDNDTKTILLLYIHGDEHSLMPFLRNAYQADTSPTSTELTGAETASFAKQPLS